MRLRILLTCLLATLAAGPARAVLALRDLVPAGVQGDSLGATLQTLEAHDRGARGAAAVWHRAGWHLARGEYGQARAAYLRAAQRLSGEDRHWARVGAARGALALGAAAEAKAAVADALRATGPVAAAARMAFAQALELEGDRQHALEMYSKLLASAPGEVGASALERVAAIHESLRHADAAAEARARLLRDYPSSPEASRIPSPAPSPGPKPSEPARP